MPHPIPTPRTAVAAIEQGLLGLLALGAIILLSLPAARGTSATFGWMPLWWLVLPATALAVAAALRRLPRLSAKAQSQPQPRARRRRQATIVAPASGRVATGAARRRARPQAA